MSADTPKCFVVMPFGKKPFKDGLFDFDKIYKTVMQRAIRLAGMEPIRADETDGNRPIHADMFKDLRDQPVVLADLSMHNPNVFYELGVRHVMSPSGTVLMCANGFQLPFDVALSRTIYYEYDGKNIDWEEAERMVKALHAALEVAKRGSGVDSPVYAFLEDVLSNRKNTKLGEGKSGANSTVESGEDLARYQQELATDWPKHRKKWKDLLKEHYSSVFGSRALGYYLLNRPASEQNPSFIRFMAQHLSGYEQYDLAIELFGLLEATDQAGWKDLMNHGAALSESQPYDFNATEQGIRYTRKAVELVRETLDASPAEVSNIQNFAEVNHALSGLLAWKWEITKDPACLEEAIHQLRETGKFIEAAMQTPGGRFPRGKYALNRLKFALFLRIMENDPQRSDTEKNIRDILNLSPDKNDPVGSSYLRWYQAIALADIGDRENAAQRSMIALAEDRKTMGLQVPGASEIGHRQYTQLRRFIENYSRYWNEPNTVAYVSQVLRSNARGQ